MKYIALVHPGMEQLAAQEINELVGTSTTQLANAVEFEATPEQITNYIYHAQSIRKLLLLLDHNKDFTKVQFADFPWASILPPDITHKVDIERVKGEANRTKILTSLGPRLVESMNEANLKPTIKLKKPDLEILVHWNGQEYIIGLDLGGELDVRSYRVFPHPGSFRGDLAYFFVRNSAYSPEEKLLVGFAKDGIMPIEAALYSSKTTIHASLPLEKLPFFPQQKPVPGKRLAQITAFDETTQNTNAMRKNTKIAGMQECLTIHKCTLDSLDVKFSENHFDRIIFHITTKDEDKLNEIYYQANYILKSGGTLMFISREKWEPSISTNFNLVKKEAVTRGESVHVFWLLEKK